MLNTLQRHPWFWAMIAVSGLCLLGLVTAVAPALALQTGSPSYHIDMQLWQDRELLTNPKLTLPQNELAEITVDDPLIVPDKVKVTLRVHRNIDAAINRDNRSDRLIVVESEIFLPQGGQWAKAASPRLVLEKDNRAVIEIPITGAGFVHPNGKPAEMLTFFVLVSDPA